VFCAIVRGEAQAYRVYEDVETLAFLDTHPLALGHVLLVPKAHVPTLFEADPVTVQALALSAQTLARAVLAAMQADGVFLAQNNIISQSVPHLHTHIVPRRKGDKLFSGGLVWRRVGYGSPEQMVETAARIRAALA
jgi:histidine triad (HIT) family protein